MYNKTLSTFFIVWAGQLIANIGMGVATFALSVHVFRITGSAVHYSLLMLAGFLPSLLLRPLGGNLADRMDRRLLMMIGDAGSALSILAIILMMYTGFQGLCYIYVGVIISSIFTALHNPAYKASVTDLVEEHYYAKASGLVQLAETSRLLISPVVAGLLLGCIAIEPVLSLTVFALFISVLSLFVVKKSLATPKQKPDTGFMEDLREGIHYLYQNKGLIRLLYITSLFSFFMGFYPALLGPMLLSFTSAEVFGIVQTISTSGMIAGSIFIATFFSQPTSRIRMLSIGLFAAGIFFAGQGLAPNIYLIACFGFLFFLALPFVNTSLDIMVRTHVPNAMQGRIWATVSLISQAGIVFAFATSGLLADYVFNPMLKPEGLLAPTIGSLIGTGDTRGIGLLFILAGIAMMMIALLISRLTILRQFEKQAQR